MPLKEPKPSKTQTRLLLTAPPATETSYKVAMTKASASPTFPEDIKYGLALCEALTAAQSYTTNKSWLSPPKPTSLSDSQLKQLAKDFPNKSNNLKNDAIFISKIHHALRYPEYAQKTLASCNTPTESQLDLARCIIQFKRLPELLNVSSLSQLKGKIKVLQALSSHSQWPKDTPSFWALCYQWLVMILEHLKKYFYSHPQLWLENFSDCQMLAQEIFTLTQTIPLQKEQWQPLIDWLEHAYTQYDQPLASAQLTIASQSTFEKMKHWCTSPYFPSFSYKLITYTYKSSHQIWLTKLDKIEKTLMQDVDCLQRWGQLRYQHALAVWASQGMVSIEPYLTAYTEVSERIQALSAQAWAFREDSSKLLREKEQEDAPYLDKLNALDEILLKVHQRMQTLSKDWLETNAKFCPDDTLIPKVNELLAYLDSNAAQTMQGLNWINHTCYSQLAEKALAPEMNARSRHQSEPYWGKLGISRRYYDKEFLSNEYHLETVYTLTDFILMKLGSERQTLKRLLLSLHPDKLSQNSENAVKEVATFCFNSITRLRKDIDTVTANWATGQWAAVGPDSISPFKQPYNYELSDIVSPNEPTQNLNLGALTWHQEYIAWLAQQAEVGASLQKNTQQVRRVKTFFNRANGEDFDIMARVFFADTQQHEIKHRGRSYAQIKQIRDDAKAEAQQAEA